MRVPSITAVRLMSTVFRHDPLPSTLLSSRKDFTSPIPALLTQMSKCPNVCWCISNAATMLPAMVAVDICIRNLSWTKIIQFRTCARGIMDIPGLLTSHWTNRAEGDSSLFARFLWTSSTRRTVSYPCSSEISATVIRTPFLASANARARPRRRAMERESED